MNFNLLLATLLVAYATSPSNAAPATPSKSGLVKNPLIVKLKKGVPQDRFRSILNNNASFTATNKLKYSYRPSFFNGFAGVFTNDFMHAVVQEYGNDIEYVEFDTMVHAYGKQPSPPSWGLTRTSQRQENLDEPYDYPDKAGEGVKVYVVDTGIQFDQADFNGRAKLDKSVVKGETAPDGNGHGTHCAGTIGSTTYGIAKNVQLFGVKVLNGQGSGQLSDVVAGMDYVASKATAGKVDVVMSMSLGGPKTQSLNDAADAAVDKGVAVIVAAGNDNKDACNYSPAGANKVLTVGAIDKKNTKASFSNFGRCVEIWGPGVGITSLWKGKETKTISGTSMATPHVAGVAALFLAEKTYTQVKDLFDDMIAASTKGLITGLDSASPNRILYNKNEPMTDPNPPTPSPGPGPAPGPAPSPGDCPIPMPPGWPCPFPPQEPGEPGEPGDCPIELPPGFPCPFPTNP